MIEQLRVIQEFMKFAPNIHVGGSLGLFLHGIRLNRDFGDIDFSTSNTEELYPGLKSFREIHRASNAEDFDTCFLYEGIKVDINHKPDKEYTLKKYLGVTYRVSHLHDILHYKLLYAYKGVEKHKQDLMDITLGSDLPIYYNPPVVDNYCDLPF